MKKILVMGLPGSGKTTLASELVNLLNAKWLNADKIRTELNDWDFSEEARLRQAKRLQQYINMLSTINICFYSVDNFHNLYIL